jgi:thiamine pyrophosphate-dependent acetolactate synthase large subunit-like protein
MTIKNNQQTAAQLLIRSLVQQKVKHIFGIPGGKIMPTLGNSSRFITFHFYVLSLEYPQALSFSI